MPRNYTIAWVANTKGAKTKACLYPSDACPLRSAVVLNFEAEDDRDAASKVGKLILPEDPRPLRGLSYLRASREQMHRASKKHPMLLDLLAFKEETREKLIEALTPLVEEGVLSRDG